MRGNYPDPGAPRKERYSQHTKMTVGKMSNTYSLVCRSKTKNPSGLNWTGTEDT